MAKTTIAETTHMLKVPKYTAGMIRQRTHSHKVMGTWLTTATAAALLGAFLAASSGYAATLAELTPIWDSLTQKHVKAQGVDYKGFDGDKAQLQQFISGHAKLKPAQLDDNSKKAAYINLYNATMIANIFRHAQAKKIAVGSKEFLALKINDISVPGGNIWNGDYKVNLAGQMVTLDNIEHQLIRGQDLPSQLKPLAVTKLDPRIHAAVNCAAKSCPPVRKRAYTAANIDALLTENMAAFLSSKAQFSKEGKDTLKANSIVQWYYSDFDDWAQKNGLKGAGEYLAGFVNPAAKDAAFIKQHLRKTFNDRSKWSLKISSDYDWHYTWLINDSANFR